MKNETPEIPRPGLRDEIMEEVRANREAYASRFGYDARAMLEHAREHARACTGAAHRKPRAAQPPRTA